jgi:hypothetical protein
MSVTFSVVRENLEVLDGQPKIVYRQVYPADFDPAQVIEDPEHGRLSPDNPWSMNLTNENAVRVLELLGEDPYSENGLVGTICNVPEFIERCDSALLAIRSFPALDAGVSPTESYGATGVPMIHLGVPADYFRTRVTRLREIAQIAIDVGGILSFA